MFYPVMTWMVIFLACAVTPIGAQSISGADTVLRKFEGNWLTHVTIRSTKLASREIQLSGMGMGQVTLGGQYVEYRAKTDPMPEQSPEEDLQINTWDPITKIYHHWLFDSEGNRFIRTGTWDEASKTLTWTANELGGTVLIHDRFIHRDRIEWDLVRLDSTGQVTMQIDAWMTRLPERKPDVP